MAAAPPLITTAADVPTSHLDTAQYRDLGEIWMLSVAGRIDDAPQSLDLERIRADHQTFTYVFRHCRGNRGTEWHAKDFTNSFNTTVGR